MKRIAWLAAGAALVLLLTGCSGRDAALPGDYEIMEGLDQANTIGHLWMDDAGGAMLDGVVTTWVSRGDAVTFSPGEDERRFAWALDGYWLTLTNDGGTWRYVDSARFSAQASDARIADQWVENFGSYNINLDADGTGWYDSVDAGPIPIAWQAHDGLLRIEYQEEDGLSFEYLQYRLDGDFMTLVPYGEDSGDEMQQVVLGRRKQALREDGEYRLIAATDETSELEQTLEILWDGTLVLGVRRGEWTDFTNGVTVLHLENSRIPVMLIEDGEKLLMLELRSGVNWLWARSDEGFAATDGALAALAGDWSAPDGTALTVTLDGAASLNWGGVLYSGPAAASGELLRIDTDDGPLYACIQRDGEDLRLALGVQAIDSVDNWPLLAPAGEGES